MKETLARPADDLEQVMNTYGNMLFRLCIVMLGNSADAVLLKAGEAPYAYVEGFGVQKYQIVDAKGDVVAEGISSEAVEITNGKISVELPLDELERGNYTLIITEFVGTAKADQDLPIKGYWECKFEL